MYIFRKIPCTTRRIYDFPYLLTSKYIFWENGDSAEIKLPKSNIPDVFGVAYKLGNLTATGSNKHLESAEFTLTIVASRLDVHMEVDEWKIFET